MLKLEVINRLISSLRNAEKSNKKYVTIEGKDIATKTLRSSIEFAINKLSTMDKKRVDRTFYSSSLA